MLKTHKFAKCFYYVAVAISFALFCYNAIELFIEYQEEKTGFNQLEHPMDEMEFPAATVCVTELFKNVGNESTADDILQNLQNHTFPLDEIFPNKLEVCQECVIQETFSYKNGLCYTVSTAVKQPKGVGAPVLYLHLNKLYKYQVIFEYELLQDKPNFSYHSFFCMNLEQNYGSKQM